MRDTPTQRRDETFTSTSCTTWRMSSSGRRRERLRGSAPTSSDGLDPDGNGPRKQEIEEPPLRRAIDIQAGKPYSTAKIDDAVQALLDLQVFSAVSIEPDLSHPESRVVNLKVHLEPTRLREVRLGGGIELDEIKTELHAITGWENHNFFGGLRDFKVTFTPGVVLFPTRIDSFVKPQYLFPEEKLQVQFRQPGFIEARTTGFIRPEFNIYPLLVQTNPDPTQPVVGYIEGKGVVGVDRQTWKLFTSLSYDVQVEDPFSYKDALDPDLHLLVIAYPELVTRLDFTDNRNHPHKGIVLSNDVQIAGGPFGGNARDVKLQPEVRGYIPLGSNLTFATRASLGFLWASNYGADIQDGAFVSGRHSSKSCGACQRYRDGLLPRPLLRRALLKPRLSRSRNFSSRASYRS